MKISGQSQKGDEKDILSSGKGRISRRFRSINVLLLVLAFLVMSGVMMLAFSGIVDNLSSDYARNFSVSSAEALSAHISKELGLLSKAARSSALIEWMSDADDINKKTLAYEEMAEVVGELYSFNLYVGLEETRSEYKVEEGITDLQPLAMLSRDNPEDAWYFECIGSDNDYILGVGRDLFMQRKRVWIDYKVLHNETTLGIICTGLEFSHIAGELFSKFDDNDMRGFIIDRNGNVQMDSALMSSNEFLYFDYERPVEDEISCPDAILLINSHLDNIQGNFIQTEEPVLTKMSSGEYRFMTITPIRYTDWSVVILSGTPSLFEISSFVPVAVIILVVLIVFTVAISAVDYRLLFRPISKLAGSLAVLTDNKDGEIYGIERDDELGILSRTIRDLFVKANVDALTGIYNRRFMENNLEQIMEFLSRSNGVLGVLMLDIDHFKRYNDTYGHDQGDVCLKTVAGALMAGVVRANDFAARYGGEEFVVVLPNTDEAGASFVAEKLIENIRGLGIPHEKNDAAKYVTVSIGVTTGSVNHMQKWEEYIKRADEALYMSKQNGRNRYTYLGYPE